MEAIVQFEQALQAMPGDVRILFALANTAQNLGLPDVAIEFYRRVLAQEPLRMEAIVNLSNLLRAKGDTDSAIALLEPALACQPDSAELNLSLGSAYREKGDRQKAMTYYRAAIQLRADYCPALANLADMLSDRGEVQAARALYDSALQSEPENAQARFNRATFHLLHGEMEQGWRDYSARTKLAGKVPSLCGPNNFKAWKGQSLERTRLLVRSEQGIGDQILFASVIPDLVKKARGEGGSIVLECEPRLVDLFARSFPDVMVKPAVLQRNSGALCADYGWLKAAGGCSAVTLMGDLPRYLRPSIAAFPKPHIFLSPDICEAARWKSSLKARAQADSNKLVGICWRSGKTGGQRTLQFAPLEAWAQFLRDVEASFVCVQYDATSEEVGKLETMSGRKILIPEMLDQKQELDRTAAMLSCLDCVVSAPTAVSWLCAGVGVPTFKLLYHASWTSLGLDYEPFAPCSSLITPRASGDWTDVFCQVKARFTQPW